MKLLLAFAAGVALTIIGFVLLGEASVNSLPDQAEAPERISSSESDLAHRTSPASQLTSETGSASSSQSSQEDSNGAGFPAELVRFAMNVPQYGIGDTRAADEARDKMKSWNNEELRALAERAQGIANSQAMLEAESILKVLNWELNRREEIAEWASAPPPDAPIHLPAEFSQHLEIASVLGNHERLQREPVDPEWAYPMETNLRDFFSSRPEIAATYGNPIINCRTTECEVAFVVYGVNEVDLAAKHEAPDSTIGQLVFTDFSAAIQGFRDQPWARDIRALPPPSVRTGEGATTLIWSFRR